MTRDQINLMMEAIRESATSVLFQKMAQQSRGDAVPVRLTLLPDDLPALAREISRNAMQAALSALEVE